MRASEGAGSREPKKAKKGVGGPEAKRAVALSRWDVGVLESHASCRQCVQGPVFPRCMMETHYTRGCTCLCAHAGCLHVWVHNPMGERGIQLRVNACESEAMWACMSVCTGWWETGVAAGGVTLEPHPVVHRDTPSRVEEGCADPDQRQRGKSGVSKRRPESTRGQSAPPGQQGQRRGRVQGGQHAPPHLAIPGTEHGPRARPGPWCTAQRAAWPQRGVPEGQG